MKEKKKKKKFLWQKYVYMAFCVLLGVACGGLMVTYMNSSGFEKTFREGILSFFVLILTLYAALFVQIIIHEAGHLVFGLLSGYKFSSFRVMSFMWVKEGGRIKFRRLTIAGTGGQCLMSPPELSDGKIPVVLYNFGGSLMNIIAGLVFLGLYFVFANVPILSTVMIITAAIGFISAVMNGVPMRMGTVDNDGYNAVSLTRSCNAMRSFWVQMKINEQISKGIRLKDMPDEWFDIPDDGDMKNSMVAAIGVFACNRLVDMHKFDEADKLMAHLLEIDSGMVDLHRNLMICDRMYIELITENRNEVIEEMVTKEQKKFMKSMKTFPSVLRTEYVYALLGEKDIAKAERIKACFEKHAKKYPYPSEIQSERELVEIAEKKA
ncbi:MAG: M50 family metallopeptidase [Clostridia bacterium]|nr:M50 family metallopeptidase [Clostridia bacterium]